MPVSARKNAAALSMPIMDWAILQNAAAPLALLQSAAADSSIRIRITTRAETPKFGANIAQKSVGAGGNNAPASFRIQPNRVKIAMSQLELAAASRSVMILLILPDISAEDDLLARAQRGSQDALRDIYEGYFSPIYQFIRLRVDDSQIAEDIAAEVFLKMLRAFRANQGPRKSLRGWLFKVARHELVNHYGRAQKLSHAALDEWMPSPPEDEPEVQFIRRLSIQQARSALKRLSAEQQEVLVLRFGQMLSLQETADIMGKQVNAVKALQFRAVNTLRRILGEMRIDHA